MALCDDRCYDTPQSSWVTRIILTNGELAITFHHRQHPPHITCLYPGTDCTWFTAAMVWPSKGRFVHAFLYRRRPYRVIPNPCPIAPCNFDISGNQSSGTQTFTVTRTWTAPAGVTAVNTECWGGGGSGAVGSANAGGGGGGGGAYAKTKITVVPSTVYDVSVGTGATVANTAGVQTWFKTSGSILAAGGYGGGAVPLGGPGGAAPSRALGCVGYHGGDGGQGLLASGGGGGGSSAGTATFGQNGQNGVLRTGGIAPTGGGDGGAGGAQGLIGVAGSAPGGGGGGSGPTFTTASGNGANGKVILTW